jgi:hypothetical protein
VEDWVTCEKILPFQQTATLAGLGQYRGVVQWVKCRAQVSGEERPCQQRQDEQKRTQHQKKKVQLRGMARPDQRQWMVFHSKVLKRLSHSR